MQCQCRDNAVSMQCKCFANEVSIQWQYSANAVSMQCQCSSNAAPIQGQCNADRGLMQEKVFNSMAKRRDKNLGNTGDRGNRPKKWQKWLLGLAALRQASKNWIQAAPFFDEGLILKFLQINNKNIPRESFPFNGAYLKRCAAWLYHQ